MILTRKDEKDYFIHEYLLPILPFNDLSQSSNKNYFINLKLIKCR